MISDVKAVLKIATVALLSFTIAPLCAAQSPLALFSQHADRSAQQKMGFTEAGQAPPFIVGKRISDDATGDDLTFSLDLYFGSDASTRTKPVPVHGIAPLIVYNSNQIKVVGISKPVRAGLLRPVSSKLKKYISDYAPNTQPTLTVAGRSVIANADKSLTLAWLDISGIAAVSGATLAQPVRVATIKFKWMPGAKDTTHIGITESEFSVARDFRGASIKVQGPAVRASIAAQPAVINVNDGPTPISVECSLSRPASAKTTCTLALQLERPDAPLASTFQISIRAGDISASKKRKIKPKAADSGRKLNITLQSAKFDEQTLAFDAPSAKISLKSPAVVVSESNISFKEGETKELQVSLAAPPNGKVVVRVRKHFHANARNVAITPASLIFTADNWSKAQTVSVSSVDDKIVDGDRFVSIDFEVNYRKSRATNYDNALAQTVWAEIMENDKASVAVTVKPEEDILTAGAHPIVITATLEGGGVYRTAKYVDLELTMTGSAKENAYYVPSTPPTKITIPERAASASTAFTLHLARATPGAIVVGATFSGTSVPIADPRVLIGEFTWDVDADGGVTTDDLALIYRYLRGDRGRMLVENMAKKNYEEIEANLRRGEGVLNVTGLRTKNGASKVELENLAHTNARVFGRYLVLSARGDDLVRGIYPPLPLDAATVLANIEAYMP